MFFCCCCLIAIYADTKSLFCRKTGHAKLNTAFVQQPLPQANFDVWGNPGARSLCNQAQVTGFPETRAGKDCAEITTEKICPGHLEEIPEASKLLHCLKKKSL